MNGTIKTFLKFGISFLLTAGFLFLSFRGTDWNALVDSLRRANYWWMVVMFIVLMLSHAVRAYRWKYFLAPIKKSVRYRNLFSSLMIGYMVNNFLPRAGELVRPYTIGKLEGFSRSSALGTVVMERLIDFLSFIVLVTFIPFAYSGPLTEQFPWLVETSVIVSVVTLFAISCILILLSRRDFVFRLFGFLTRWIPKPTAEKIEQIAHKFLDGFLFLKEPKHYAMIILTSILVWLLYIIMMWVAFFSFQEMNNSLLDFSAALVLQAMSSIGVAIPTPGATGSYHLITIQSLTRLYGINETVARSYATLTHAVGFLGVVVVGLYYFIRDHLRVSEVLHENIAVEESK